MLCFITVFNENCNSSYEENTKFCTCIMCLKIKTTVQFY